MSGAYSGQRGRAVVCCGPIADRTKGSTGEHLEVEALTAGGSGVNDRFLAAIA
jgi:hypothetical protein